MALRFYIWELATVITPVRARPRSFSACDITSENLYLFHYIICSWNSPSPHRSPFRNPFIISWKFSWKTEYPCSTPSTAPISLSLAYIFVMPNVISCGVVVKPCALGCRSPKLSKVTGAGLLYTLSLEIYADNLRKPCSRRKPIVQY